MAQPAIIEELPFRDPVHHFVALHDQPGLVFLDSAGGDESLARYAYLAFDPYQHLTGKNGHAYLDGKGQSGHPLAVLKDLMAGAVLEPVAGLPPFQGGAAGLFGYDLAWDLEQLPTHQADDLETPDLNVGFYDLVLAYDLVEHRCWAISTGMPELRAAGKIRARARLEQLKELLNRYFEITPYRLEDKPLSWRSSDSDSAYKAKVQRVVDYIYAGDIFQANLSQRFQARLPEDFDTPAFYLHLRRANPAPFAAYYDLGGDQGVIASCSPERFLRLDGDQVVTRPIKGTRPRGLTLSEDKALAEELLASEKDRAENVMIVDLLRNDISRVCQPGSVKVPELCVLESYATVHHLVSTVVGQLKPGNAATDLLAACFPGGSITGAPKVRAMEIIAELEASRRGPYCGSIGYLGFNGTLDSSILIRTLLLKDNQVTFQAGGGIVADSDPTGEFEETLVKAQRLFEALGGRREVFS